MLCVQDICKSDSIDVIGVGGFTRAKPCVAFVSAQTSLTLVFAYS